MDDVDAAEALQAKNMLLSGDWVTQHLNGTVYLDKAPLKYWLTASLYSVFGIHDWVARLPTAIAVLSLCWLVTRMAGFYSGLVMATSIGLFLFTRTVIPDVILTLFITVSLWCFIRILESNGPSPNWAMGMYAAMACAVLTKGFIGVLFPAGIILVYTLLRRSTWRRLYILPGIVLFIAIVAPWHVMAILRNPPALDFTLHAGPHFGNQFRGFFWFYFINEHFLRFLNERWPRDYNTVPRIWFWAYHFIWFFPWILFGPALRRVTFSRLHFLAACWIAEVMLFFTFSTTQEYYSMPIYPAIAILLGSAMAAKGRWPVIALKAASLICLIAAFFIAVILMKTWSLGTPGDIVSALVPHPYLYTLSLGHMADLSLPAFAYLRSPLEVAGCALAAGGSAALLLTRHRAILALALMLVVFFQAAQMALVVFDPYLSSFAIAQKLNQLPTGVVIVCGKYNPLSSVFFYSKDGALQNDSDLDILEYGTLAPGAPRILAGDEEMKRLWNSDGRIYIVAKAPKLGHVKATLGIELSSAILKSGDKYLFTNSKTP